jgi:hypothetical protein
MATTKRRSPEQMVRKPVAADRLLTAPATIADYARVARWRWKVEESLQTSKELVPSCISGHTRNFVGTPNRP